MCPPFFNDYFNISNESIVSICTRGKNYYTPNNLCKSEWGETSFRFNSIKLWLNLPEEIKCIQNLNCFKKCLYSHLLTQQINVSKPDDEVNLDSFFDC